MLIFLSFYFICYENKAVSINLVLKVEGGKKMFIVQNWFD